MGPIHPPRVAAERPRWESFTDGGRLFLRTALHDDPGATFSIARSLVGRYDVEQVVSCGEATVLLRAHDTRTNRPVAIKALRNDVVNNALDLTAALRHARHVLQTERRLLVRLRNAGSVVVPVPVDYVYDRNPALPTNVDPFLATTEPYLVLPFLTGEPLEIVLDREFPSGMDETHSLRALLPVVRTMAELNRPWRHQSGRTWHCVYQDLKPANLMMGPNGLLTLIDFGGCQVVVDGVAVLEGSCTPGYAPPECDEGPARVLLGCADVFTIGSTLYHMLTGIDPRARSSRRRGRAEPFDLRALSPQTSPGLRKLLARCLASRPSERPADAGRVADAIAELLAAGIESP